MLKGIGGLLSLDSGSVLGLLNLMLVPQPGERPARVRRMTPIITAFKSVRRHLMDKSSIPPQGVAHTRTVRSCWRESSSAHLIFLLTFLEEQVASIPSPSYQSIYTLHAQRAGCIPRMSVFGALFIRLRGIGILGSLFSRGGEILFTPGRGVVACAQSTERRGSWNPTARTLRT